MMHDLARNSHATKMSTNNLVICIGPNLVCSCGIGLIIAICILILFEGIKQCYCLS